MRAIISYISLLLIVQMTYGQFKWTPPVQITLGSGEDSQPTTVNSSFRVRSSEEWLAFSRFNYISSNICLVNSHSNATAWSDSVYYITDDSASNHSPSLAQAFYNIDDYRMMIVWQRGYDLYYRYRPTDTWLPLQALTQDSVTNESADVAPCDTGFGLVWERNGKIQFSEFYNDIWSVPITISQPGDTNNFSPKLAYLEWQNVPFVVWEHKNYYDTSHSLMYTFRKPSGWISPHISTSVGDNRHLFLARQNWTSGIFLIWESNRTGNWDIFELSGNIYGDSLYTFDPESNITNTPEINEHDCSNMVIGIITQSLSKKTQFIFPGAAVWRSVKDTTDDITLSSYGLVDTSMYSISQNSIDRNPIISTGISLGNIIRVWGIWESNANGQWKLYGSQRDIIIDDVIEQQNPSSYKLFQNYPNPANPSTTITYFLPERSQVKLILYNILGQAIKTLINENQYSGHHSIILDAGTLATGVYFYQLSTSPINRNGNRLSNNGHYFSNVKKLLIIR